MNETVKIGVVGCAGRMGRAIIALAERQGNAHIVGGVALPSEAKQTLAALAGVENSRLDIFPHTNAKDMIEQTAPDVVIDFSLPDNVGATLDAALAANIPLVIGVTGLTEVQFTAVEEAAKKIPVLYSATMSKGINILLALTKKVAAITGESFDVEITEMHHRHKIDAPSGVAVALGKSAADGRGVNYAEKARYAREGRVGARPVGEIGFSTLRGGSVFGDHSVLFAGDNEHITLSHSARNREVFAEGAVFAALKLHGRPKGLYSMQDVLDLSVDA